MSRIGTEFLDLGTWADEEDPGAGPQEQDNSRINGNWIKIDKFAKENKIWIGETPPPTEFTIEHTLWLDISNIDLPVMKKWKISPGEWAVLWTWNHGDLEDLEDDQHPQYLLRNGERKLDANYIPTENKSIATKEYVDGVSGGWAPFFGAAVQNISELRAIPQEERIDKQIRYVEDKKAIYGYNAEGNPITTENQIENCDDAWNQYVYHDYTPGDEKWITSEIDTTDKQEGSAAIKLTAEHINGQGNPIPGMLYVSEDITVIDLRDYSFLRFWVKPSTQFANKQSYIILSNGVIDDDTPPPEEVRLPLPTNLTPNEWQEVILYFSDAIVTGGNIDDILENVITIGFRLSGSEWVDSGENILIDNVRAFKTADDNNNYIVPDDLTGVWEKISDITNPLQNDLDAGGNKIKNLGAPVDDADAVRKSDLDNGLEEKAEKKDYPLQWIINGFITDGTQIDAAPSANGYNAGEQYAVNHSGNNHNGNVYIVNDDDTWRLLDVRKKGLGVLLDTNLTEYYYSSNTINGWWNDNLALKQDKPSTAAAGNVAVFDNNRNTIAGSLGDAVVDIDTDANSDENTAPNMFSVRKNRDGAGTAIIFGVNEVGKIFNITGKAILTPATYIVDETGYGDYKHLQACLDYIAGDIANRKGLIHIRKGDYTNYGVVTFDNSISWEDIEIKGEWIATKLKGITIGFDNTNNTAKKIIIRDLLIDAANNDGAISVYGDRNNSIFAEDITLQNLYIVGGYSKGLLGSLLKNSKFINNIVDRSLYNSRWDALIMGDMMGCFMFGNYVYNHDDGGNAGAAYRFIDWNGYTKYNTIQNCYAINCNSKGFYIRVQYNNDNNNNTFVGCQGFGNSKEDFFIDDNTAATKNKIIGCVTDGNVVIGGNRNSIQNCTASEITLNGTNHSCIGNTVDTITDNSTGSDVAHNN